MATTKKIVCENIETIMKLAYENKTTQNRHIFRNEL